MIKFQENTLTDVRREGQADSITLDPSSYCQGTYKYNPNRLAFKSKKLLHHSQHAKNQLNP